MKALILGRNGQLGLLEAPVPIHAIAKTDDPTAVRRPRYSVLDTSSSCAALVTPVKDRPCHDWRYAIDAGRIEQELGFSTAQGLASGLLGTLT